MSARYGSRTQSGEAVSGFGQRSLSAISGGQTFYEETFTAPGTWTWPGSVTHVEVLLVGGGGGGGANPGGGSGGGGGVRWELDVPVSAPVPVTVGAGGVGSSSPTAIAAGVGGDSTFGPLVVGGGGGGANPGTTPSSCNAPPNGGGGGGRRSPPVPSVPSVGGDYGVPGIASQVGGGATLDGTRSGYGASGGVNSLGKYAGQVAQDSGDSRANTGTGGNFGAYDGGSGIVIVRYWQ